MEPRVAREWSEADERAAEKRDLFQARLKASDDMVAALESAPHPWLGGEIFQSIQRDVDLRERLLINAGFDSPEKPAFLDVVLAAREDRVQAAAVAGGDEDDFRTGHAPTWRSYRLVSRPTSRIFLWRRATRTRRGGKSTCLPRSTTTVEAVRRRCELKRERACPTGCCCLHSR
jgi:hypothetical protein